MSNKINSKYDYILILIFVSIALLTISYFYVVNMGNRMQNFKSYKKVTQDLLLLDVEINNFLKNETGFRNYDIMVRKVKKFRKHIKILDNEKFYDEFGKDLKKELKDIEECFEKKVGLIERYKTYHATTIGSIGYILNLSKKLKAKELSKSDALMLDEIIKEYLNFFIYHNYNKENVERNIKILQQMYDKYKLIEFKFIEANIKAGYRDISNVDEIIQDVAKLHLYYKVLDLDTTISKRYEKTINQQKMFTLISFLISLILMFLMIWVYFRSLKTKKELIAFRYAVDNSDDTVVMTDVNRRITYVNDAFVKNTHYTKEEAYGKNPRILKSGLLPDIFYKNLNDTLDRGEKWFGEFINKTKDGEIYYERASITPMFIDDKLTGYLAIKLNVTEYIKAKDKAEYLAYHDQLTELPNRIKFDIKLKEILDSVKDSIETISIAIIDLDGFKYINDTLGHYYGDEMLKIIARRIAEEDLREGDELFRIGGDEFLVLFKPNTPKEVCSKVSHEIIETINKKADINSHILQVGASIGLAEFPTDANSAQELLKCADIALNKVKSSGKNSFKYYTSDLYDEIQRKIKIEQALVAALESDEFYNVYQPKYSLKTKEIYSLEVLVRWNSKTLGIISPNEFIPVAEEMNIVGKIWEKVMSRACGEFVAMKKECQNLKMFSVNISAVQLKDETLFSKLKEYIEVYGKQGLRASNIGIEVTETHVMSNLQESQCTLNRFKDYGCKIFLDDFGTGYSSMAYLKKLPIDLIKIDKEFTDGVAEQGSDTQIVKAVVAISEGFGFKVVAEGIETKEQEDILLQLGVDYGQGFYFCKPKTKDEIIEFFKSV
jgi:diguanylate cyclase (GGDEF)-like protein/PAS domain S-box-containing protein